MDVAGPRLDWFEIDRYKKTCGELLAAFELLLDEGGELPFTPPKASPPHTHYIVPSGIRPVLQKHRIEVRCYKCIQKLTVSNVCLYPLYSLGALLGCKRYEKVPTAHCDFSTS